MGIIQGGSWIPHGPHARLLWYSILGVMLMSIQDQSYYYCLWITVPRRGK